jgi:hypothetical protein
MTAGRTQLSLQVLPAVKYYKDVAVCHASCHAAGIDNSLTCCNGTCIAAPYNASNPEAACGIKAKPVCTFDQLLVKSSKFNAANAFAMAVLGKAVYPDAWALPDNDTLVSQQSRVLWQSIEALATAYVFQ